MAEDVASLGLGSLAMAPLVGFRASSGMARLTGDTTSPEFAGPLPKAASASESGEVRARVLAYIAESKDARRASNFSLFAARDAQVTGGYVADDFVMTTIPKGTIVYGGNPKSSWFTDSATVRASGLSQQLLWDSLQVQSSRFFGPRVTVNGYELLQDLRVPTGQALNNPLNGSGGGWQFYLNGKGTSSVLKPINNLGLH
jgi:filamentous hemagglutinin